jgi:cellulose biosynthesis protein BcsQ
MKIAIINHKGGVGKTTLAVNIAFRYAEKRKQLALIDFDNQCNAMQLFSGFE